MKQILISLLLVCTGLMVTITASAASPMELVDAQIDAHPGLSGVYVLDKGSEALVARAWLTDHAQHSIEVQYFIWSTDNIGILAAEALLRAASRGVQVRVIVDDLLINAPDKSLLALAKHPNIEIRIYNPQHSVGTTWYKRLLNVITNFRGANQRMHDKTFIVDGKVAITGGRNMAAEYFDYNQQFNFRDRDVLLLGDAVRSMQQSFESFWDSNLSAQVESLYEDVGLMQKRVAVDSGIIKKIYRDLHEYANSEENFSPEVRANIGAVPSTFPRIAQQLIWSQVSFISDRPGKNPNKWDLGGGGRTTTALAQLVKNARERIVIQSPYLVMSDDAMTLFQEAIKRGVKVYISTNSLASTDNLLAFSGYRNQRAQLLNLGVNIYEYKPDSLVQRSLMERLEVVKERSPVFAIHAKTMIVDTQIVYIGTFNFDPRSQNLNTEMGVIIHNSQLAKAVEESISTDMQSANSWSAEKDDPDQYVPFTKRIKVRLLQMLPLQPVL